MIMEKTGSFLFQITLQVLIIQITSESDNYSQI